MQLFSIKRSFKTIALFSFILSGLKRYKAFFTLPYFIFVRDTLSYMVLLGLHFAICLEPSSLSFSRLEWVILILFMGRFLIEGMQVTDKTHGERQNANENQKKNLRYLHNFSIIFSPFNLAFSNSSTIRFCNSGARAPSAPAEHHYYANLVTYRSEKFWL